MLVDTAVWIDHLRRGDPILVGLLEQVRVTVHPFVVGEVACGHLANRTEVLDALEALPKAPIVEHSAVLAFVERNALMGRGLGWVDMHLLASASASGERILTRTVVTRRFLSKQRNSTARTRVGASLPCRRTV